MQEADIAEVDAILAAPKALSGVFDPGRWSQAYGREWSYRWGVVDQDGIQIGDLAFAADERLLRPSISLIVKRHPIYRLDIVPPDEAKPNPHDAWRQGLPREVVGSHTHPWRENRDWVRSNGFIGLPYRKPTPKALRTLPQALAATASDVNIKLRSDQRDCALPAQAALFGRT